MPDLRRARRQWDVGALPWHFLGLTTVFAYQARSTPHCALWDALEFLFVICVVVFSLSLLVYVDFTCTSGASFGASRRCRSSTAVYLTLFFLGSYQVDALSHLRLLVHEGQNAGVGVGIFAAELLGHWFDKVCIDQSNISEGLFFTRQWVHRSKQHRRSLRVLPVNVMACNRWFWSRFSRRTLCDCWLSFERAARSYC